MKKILSLLVIVTTFCAFTQAQTKWVIGKYNIPYTLYGDTIKGDTISVIAEFNLNEEFNLVSQVYASDGGDTVAADVNVFRSLINDENAYDLFFTYDSLNSDNVVNTNDTLNSFKFIKYEFQTTDTAIYNIVIQALKKN